MRAWSLALLGLAGCFGATGYRLGAPGHGGLRLFAGDTGLGPHFAQIRTRVGRPRLAVLPIGAYLPRWFMKPFGEGRAVPPRP